MRQVLARALMSIRVVSCLSLLMVLPSDWLTVGGAAAARTRHPSAAQLRAAGQLWEAYSASSTTCKLLRFVRDRDGRISGADVRLKTDYPTVFGVVYQSEQPPVALRAKKIEANAQFDGQFGLVYFTGTHPMETSRTRFGTYRHSVCDVVKPFPANGIMSLSIDFPEVATFTTAPWFGSTAQPEGSVAVSVMLLPAAENDNVFAVTTCIYGYGSRRWVPCSLD